MKKKIVWFAQVEGIAWMGPFKDQIEAAEATFSIEGYPKKGAFTWPEKEGERDLTG